MVGLKLQVYSQPFENQTIHYLNVFVQISNVFFYYKMLAICSDFNCLGFQISDPIQNPDHLQPNLFSTILNPDLSRFQIPTLSLFKTNVHNRMITVFKNNLFSVLPSRPGTFNSASVCRFRAAKSCGFSVPEQAAHPDLRHGGGGRRPGR